MVNKNSGVSDGKYTLLATAHSILIRLLPKKYSLARPQVKEFSIPSSHAAANSHNKIASNVCVRACDVFFYRFSFFLPQIHAQIVYGPRYKLSRSGNKALHSVLKIVFVVSRYFWLVYAGANSLTSLYVLCTIHSTERCACSAFDCTGVVLLYASTKWWNGKSKHDANQVHRQMKKKLNEQ